MVQPLLGGIVAGFMICTSIIILLANKQLSLITRKRRNSKSILLGFVNTRLRAIQTIQGFNKEIPAYKRYEKRSKKVLQSGQSYQKITAILRSFIPFTMYLMLAAILVATYYLKQQNTAINGSMLIVFVMMLITILPVFQRLLRVNIVWELGNISFEKLLKIFHQVDMEQVNKPVFERSKGHILLNNLSYQFPGKAPLFEALNWQFPAYSMSLISGQAGSGKATLIKLLSGLYPLQNGLILIDDQATSEYQSKSIRKHITLVSTHYPLLGKTVFECISYSRKLEKRDRAAKILAQLQSSSLHPLQLDDKVGDLAILLSKGQQKLLSYARAFLSRKKILLIEEPFQDLDEASIVQISRLLNKMKKKHTILLFSNQSTLPPLKIDRCYKLKSQDQKIRTSGLQNSFSTS